MACQQPLASSKTARSRTLCKGEIHGCRRFFDRPLYAYYYIPLRSFKIRKDSNSLLECAGWTYAELLVPAGRTRFLRGFAADRLPKAFRKPLDVVHLTAAWLR